MSKAHVAQEKKQTIVTSAKLTAEGGGRGQLSFTVWCTPSFRPSEICKRNNKIRRTRTGQLKLKKQRKEPSNFPLSDLLSKLQPVAHSPSFSFNFSHHIPLLHCHSPSTVRERLSLLWHRASLQRQTQLPGLRHFLAQHIQGMVATTGFPHCARKNRTKKGIPFRTTIRRRCPNSGFFGQPQETDCPLIQLRLLLPKGANLSAHTPWAVPQEQRAWTTLPSWESPAPSCQGRIKARCVAPTSPGHSNKWMLCADAQCPTGPGKARRLHSSASPTSFAKSSPPQYCRPLQPAPLATTNYEPKASTKKGFSKHSNAFARDAIASLRCSSHKYRWVLVLPKIQTCPWPLSLPTELSLFDSHSVF